jgi:hypothetical protein
MSPNLQQPLAEFVVEVDQGRQGSLVGDPRIGVRLLILKDFPVVASDPVCRTPCKKRPNPCLEVGKPYVPNGNHP